jgi:hypothetical protein
MQHRRQFFALFAASLFFAACNDDSGGVDESVDAGGTLPDSANVVNLEHPEESVIYDFANTCVRVGIESGEDVSWLQAGDEAFAFDASDDGATSLFMRASALGTYLFHDPDGGYLYSEDGPVERRTELDSDIYLVDDTYISGAEWALEFSERASFRWQLRHRKTGELLGAEGLVGSPQAAAILTIESADGCTAPPEMSLDATGEVTKTTYDDGTLFGFADTHSHILSSTGFGGGGVFHGQAFHRLGVEHAMGTCEPFHGPDGRADFVGWGAGTGGEGLDTDSMIAVLSTGLLPEPAHATDGWPTFSEWPSQQSATHQTQYYKWLERAWMSGLRLMVQHMVSNEALCQLMANTEFQPVRYGCEDMLNVDRQIVRVYEMQDYIDAQWGGPGEGWFRIVHTPAEAREVIAQGKLAIVLGIEVPNLFDCYLVQREGGPECNAEHIEAELDRYHELGIRALFPNHKYDNAFTPGDGDKGIFELGNFMQTGHWSNYVEDCPDVPTVFDRGSVQFGGFNEPREDYLAEPPNEILELSTSPLRDLLPFTSRIMEPSLPGNWCQNAGLTDKGRTLIEGIIKRGMIPEIDHLPRRSYLEVFGMLEDANYPAIGTHGNTNNGLLYEIGGISKTGFSRCADPANPGSMARRFRERRDMLTAAGGFPAEGFGFDLNGLAGVPDSRFGPDANCAEEQQDPLEYPFTSYAGDVTFTEPFMGERQVDFNTEGMIHIGLVAELVEDARRTGVTDEDLDIVFKSAEAYVRLWERAEARAAELNAQ